MTFCNFAPSCRKPELEQLQQNQQICVLFEESTVTFTFIYPLFQIYFPTDSVSHLNIIYSFIIYFFLITTHLPTFFYSTPNYYNRKKGFEE